MAKKITLQGYHQVLAKAKSIEEYVKVMAAAALYSEGQKILALSKTRVPVVTGQLLNSAYIEPPQMFPGGAMVELGYSAPYATKVHFTPAAGKTQGTGPPPKFKPYKPGSWATTGSWFYLQGPALEAAPTASKRMGEEMRLRLQAFVRGLPK